MIVWHNWKKPAQLFKSTRGPDPDPGDPGDPNITVSRLSILCSDIVGAKKAYQTVTAQRFDEMLRCHADSIASAIVDIDATIIEIENDAVYVALETDTLTTINTAIRLQEMLIEQSNTLGFQCCIAVATGDMVKTEIGDSVTFSGPVTKLAKGLCLVGAAQSVLIDSSTNNALVQLGTGIETEQREATIPFFNRQLPFYEVKWSSQLYGLK